MDKNTSQENKSKKPWYKKWWVIFLAIIILYFIGESAMDNASTKDLDNKINDAQPKTQEVTVGQEGYLRVSNSSSPDQVIILTENKEDYSQVTKSLLANDYVGILEIPTAFGVGNGTKVQVIESAVGLRKVRIIETYRDIDKDKELKSGWTAKEFVFNQ